MKTLFAIVAAHLIPDIVISYGIVEFLQYDNPWTTFLIIFIGIQIFFIIRWIVGSISYSIVYKTFLENDSINEIFSILKENNFPSPIDYGFGKDFSEQYYRNIVLDDNIEPRIRIIANTYYTEIKFLRNLGQIQALFRLLKMHSKGIEKYQEYLDYLNLK